jgi:hypothetical protein
LNIVFADLLADILSYLIDKIIDLFIKGFLQFIEKIFSKFKVLEYFTIIMVTSPYRYLLKLDFSDFLMVIYWITLQLFLKISVYLNLIFLFNHHSLN